MSQLSRLSILPTFNVTNCIIIALSSLTAYCLQFFFYSRRNNVYSRKGKNESCKSSFKNFGRPIQIRFQAKELWTEGKKKNLDYLPLPLYQIQGHHRSQRKKHFMAWRVGERKWHWNCPVADSAVTKSATCSSQSGTSPLDFFSHIFAKISLKSLFKISNPVFFQLHVTKLVKHGPLTASNDLGKIIELPHSFLQSLLCPLVLP